MPPKIDPFLAPLRELFADHADPEIAAGQAAYMKGKFGFFGIKSPLRRSLTRQFLKEHGHPPADRLEGVVRSAWKQPQREFQYTGMELLGARAKKAGPEILPLAEELILDRSWWDTVDHLAVHVVGEVLRRHRPLIPEYNARWLRSGELWWQRTALIFQLQYKTETDVGILFANVRELAGHPDFFIRKGIGWALRQYARIDPRAVKGLLEEVRLSPLSVREAMKHL
jgi:3-methyladenine DNA glycosylase AlkD